MRTEEEIRQRVTKLVNAEPVYKYDEVYKTEWWECPECGAWFESEKEAFSHVSEGPRCRKQELKTLLWVLKEDNP